MLFVFRYAKICIYAIPKKIDLGSKKMVLAQILIVLRLFFDKWK